MDFWKIVGIVLLISAVSGLLVLVGELREDKQKRQVEAKKPVQPMEPPKLSEQEEKKPLSEQTEQQEKQIPAQETPTAKEKTVQSQGAADLFDAMYAMHQHERWGHGITKNHRIVQRLNQIHHNLTYGDIPEVDCPTVIRLLKKNDGHALNWETVYFTDYHYDDNGILRKIETTNPDYPKIPANEALADVQIFDEKGNILRHGPAFVDFSKRSFQEIPPVLDIHSGAIRNGQYGYERYEFTMENIFSDTFEPKPIAKDGWELYWRTYVPFAGEKRTVDYWYGRTFFPEAPGYEDWSFKILKCSPKFKDRLSEQIPSGECGDEMTWKQVGDTLYIDGEGVLDSYAFQNDSSIRKVVIAPGCTEIGEGAFFDCENLQTVELPEGLLRIGEEAFLDCENLQEINLPEGLQEIGAHVFSSCKNLKLQISDSVTEIGKDAFEDVPEIVYCGPAWDEVDWLAEKWVNIHEVCDGGNWKIKDNTLYVYVNGELPLKEFEVRSIHHRFSETEIRSPWDPYNDRFEHVVIAPGCAKISRDSFCYCRNLKTISIPDTVKEIEEYAFYGCKRLTSIEIPDSVIEIGDNAFEDIPCIIYNGPARSEDNWGAFAALRMENDVLHIHCQGSLMSVPKLNVKEVVIHEGCTDIEVFAFMDWDNLDTVHTPFSLRHIDQNAFSGCHDVTLNMLNSRPVWNSRDNVFSGVYRVLSWLPHRIEGDTLYIGPDDEETPYILQMRDEGVYGMNWMEPDTWERYRGYPWGSRVINKIRAAVIAPGCQEIDESVFYGHTALETVKIPMGVLKIGMYAFAGCENLKDLEIPDSVTEIGRDAFRDVPNIIYHGPAQSDDNWGAKSRN